LTHSRLGPNRSSADKERGLLEKAHPWAVFVFANEPADGIALRMNIDQDFVNPVLATYIEPNLQQGCTLNRQKTLWCALGQRSQSSPETARQEEGFHSEASIREDAQLRFMKNSLLTPVYWQEPCYQPERRSSASRRFHRHR